MPIRSISRMGHPVLRQETRPLTPDEVRSPEIQRLMDDMVETMRDADGVGLAAPQVYETIQLLVAEVSAPKSPESKEPFLPLLILVNPTLVKASREKETDWEGCLSIPDIWGMVPRHRSVVVKGLDRTGRAITVETRGYAARILQHEMDHLHGILFLDRMDDMKTLAFKREYHRHWAKDDEE